MSWNDPCSGCDNPRRDCTCVYIPPPPLTEEQIKQREITQKENEAICKEKGHAWLCVIVCGCTRCGYSEGY